MNHHSSSSNLTSAGKILSTYSYISYYASSKHVAVSVVISMCNCTVNNTMS